MFDSVLTSCYNDIISFKTSCQVQKRFFSRCYYSYRCDILSVRKVGRIMTIGEKIKCIRREKGLTQKKLGELCGIAESNIRKYENGKQNPKIETVRKIAYALNVPITELIFTDEFLIPIVEDNQLDNNSFKDLHQARQIRDIRQFCKWVQSTGIAVTPRIIKDEIDGVVFVIKDKSYLIKNLELEKIISMSLSNVESVIETIGKEVSW